MAIVSLKLFNIEITQKNLEAELKKQSGHTATKVEDVGDGSLLVFFPCKRVYEVEKKGDVKYIGKEDEIKTVIVTADKESDLNLKQIQAVKITVKKYNADENENITIQYAWNQSKTNEPKTSEYQKAELEENANIAIIDSGEQSTGNYYLWVKVKAGNTEEIQRTYGEYYIQEYTTLVNTNKENSVESGFLGNTDIQRGKIRSVTLTNSIEGKEVGKDNCWDAGNKEGGIVLAWYTTETIDGNTYYNVTIGQKGKVIANANSQNLFMNIGTNVTEEVKIEGLEYLDTSNVINMSYMFHGCTGLTSLNLNKFDTSSVTSMRDMFYNCKGLTSLDVSKFNTSNVTNMQSMFRECTALESLDVSRFDTSSVTTMSQMFANCSKLTSLNLISFDTSSVTNMASMFYNCQGLTNLDLSKFDTSSVINMAKMFSNCQALTSLDISKFNTSSVTNMESMFDNCQGLTNLDLSNFNTSSVTNMASMFKGCTALESLDVSRFDTSSVTTMSQMFANCSKLTSLNLISFDTSSVTNMASMFYNCQGLTSLDLNIFNTSRVTTMLQMFNNCLGLKSLDLSSFNTSSVTDMGGMFFNCSSLTTIYATENFTTEDVISSNNMFLNSKNIIGGKGTKYNASFTNKTYAKIDGGTENPGYFTRK